MSSTEASEPTSEPSSSSASPFGGDWQDDPNALRVPETIKQGVLVKEGHVFRTWKARWFELTSDGMLSYYEAAEKNAGRDPRSELLGSIFLNGATVELHDDKGEPVLQVHSQQAKVLLVKAPALLRKEQAKQASAEQRRQLALDYLRDWHDALRAYTERPYHPGSIVLAAYDPPLPLGEGPTVYDAAMHFSLESLALNMFDVRVDPKKNAPGSFRLRSSVAVETIAPGRLVADVTRSIRDFFELRKELARWYPRRLLPPLTEYYPVRFVKRLCADAVLQLAPPLHEFLGLTGTAQLRDKAAIAKQLKYMKQVHDEIMDSSRTKIFRSEIEPPYPDPVWPLLQQLGQQLADAHLMTDRARDVFASAQVRQHGACKAAASDVKSALDIVASVSPALHPLVADVAATLDDLVKIDETYNDGRYIEAGLAEYAAQLEQLQSLVQTRRALLLGYQLRVQSSNKDKQALADMMNSPELAAPKPSPRSSLAELFFSGGDLPKQIKLAEQRIAVAEKQLHGRKALLHQFSTVFADDVRKQAQWFAHDFTFLMEKYAHHHIAAHEKSIEAWKKFLATTATFQPSAPDPLSDWAHANVVGRMNTLPQTIPVMPVDLRSHADYRPILSTAERHQQQLNQQQLNQQSTEQQSIEQIEQQSIDQQSIDQQQIDQQTHQVEDGDALLPAGTGSDADLPLVKEISSPNAQHSGAAQQVQVSFDEPSVSDSDTSNSTNDLHAAERAALAGGSSTNDLHAADNAAIAQADAALQSLVEELETEQQLGVQSLQDGEAEELERTLPGWRDMDVSDKALLANRLARCPNPALRDYCFDIYESVLRTLDTDAELAATYPNLQAQLLYRLAVAYYWKQNLPDARTSIQRLLACDAGHVKGRLLAQLVDRRNFDLAQHLIPDSPSPGGQLTQLGDLLPSVRRSRSGSSMYHAI